jgi:hypothetical protein
MKKAAVVLAVALAMILAAALLNSRREAPSRVSQDLAPFEKAVVAYLNAKSFGMKPVQLEELLVQDQTATVRYRLQDAEGMYKVAVLWTFTCKRDGQAGWVVTGHTAESKK